MSQHYIVLRMASSRHLHDEAQHGFVGSRPRYYSTPSDLRDVSPASQRHHHAFPASQRHHHYQHQQQLPATASTGRLLIPNNRIPNLRRAASAAVRSTGDIAALSAAAGGSRTSRPLGMPRALQYHYSHDIGRNHTSDADARSCDDDDDNDTELHVLVDCDAADVLDATGYDDNEASNTATRLSKETMFIVAAWIVLLTSGGLILGFGPIYAALVREGQWSELCQTSDSNSGMALAAKTPCPRQEIHLQYVFSTSFLCLSAANAVFGVMLDACGPRVTALCGLALACTGNVCFALGDSASGSGTAIIAGYALIGAGGMGAYLAAFQLLQLYRVQGVVCSTLSSLFNCSGYIYMMLEIDGVTRQAFFRAYGVLVAVCMVLCFVLFPTNSIVRPAETLAIPGLRLEMPRLKTPTGLVTGMKQQLVRSDLWYFAVFFGWLSLIFAFAGGAIPSLLAALADGNNTRAASVYTSVLYPVVVNGTFLYSPVVGFVIDRYGFKAVFFACLALVQLFITLLLVPSLPVQLLTFVVYAMAQACLYSLQFAYIMMCFPAELNGTLQAFMATVAFAFGLLNYVLNPWAQTSLHGDYTVVLTVLALPTLLLYVFVDVVQGCEDQIVCDDGNDDDDGDDDVIGRTTSARSPAAVAAAMPALSETTKLIE